MADEALDMMDKTGGVLQGFKSLGIDVFKEINTSPFLKGVLNFILSILGFTGGFEGLQKRWYRRRIDKQLDENKKSQISSIFQAYLNKTNTSPIAEKDKLTTLFKNNIKFPPNSSLFDVDGNAIIASIDEKLTDVDSLNPAVIKTVAGGAYITTTTEHVEQTKNGKTQTVKVKKESINTEKFMKDKEKIFPKYLAYMTKQLAENADYVQKVDSADTVAFTMISSLFIQPYHVIDGVQAKVFLPEAFVEQPAKTSTSDETPEQTETSNLTDEQLAKYALDITITGESRGNYGAVNKNDVDGVSLGIIQWHKERAVQLLKRLQNADATLFASLMKDPLFQDLEKAGMSVWNDAQAQQFQTLMTNEVFKQEMDKQAIEDFRGYIQQIKALGVFQPSALILLARLRNAGPERCRTKIIEPLSPEDRNNPDKIYEQFKTTAYAVKWGTGSFELAMAEVKKLPITDNVA
ncbi:MAG: hypothetical protein LBP53_02410 [Candidatus Peribacteria bacterium]|nr:hypothetical protein [Candidatus Peribacteria bacterium]